MSGKDWIHMAQVGKEWGAPFNTAIFSGYATGGFSRRIQLHGVR
jgi:hypothetical protein